jgi:hypothetical protein
VTTIQQATSAQTLTAALRFVANGIENGLPEPSSISLHTYDDRTPIVSLSFYADGKDKVLTWAAANNADTTWMHTHPNTAGDKFLTVQSFDAVGVVIQMHGSDLRPCVWLGGCDQPSAANPEQLCTGHAPVDGEVVETVPALPAAEPKRDILTNCNWIGGCDEPLGEDDGSLLCKKHPTIDEIVNGTADNKAGA